MSFMFPAISRISFSPVCPFLSFPFLSPSPPFFLPLPLLSILLSLLLLLLLPFSLFSSPSLLSLFLPLPFSQPPLCTPISRPFPFALSVQPFPFLLPFPPFTHPNLPPPLLSSLRFISCFPFDFILFPLFLPHSHSLLQI